MYTNIPGTQVYTNKEAAANHTAKQNRIVRNFIILVSSPLVVNTNFLTINTNFLTINTTEQRDALGIQVLLHYK